VTDAINGTTFPLSPDCWGEKLDDGEPMDYEDNWGKRSDPNYELRLGTNDKLELANFSDKAFKVFAIEFWVMPEIVDQ
jgi:hypothetical protein